MRHEGQSITRGVIHPASSREKKAPVRIRDIRPGDPSPRWMCQYCQVPFFPMTGAEAQKFAGESSRIGAPGSIYGANGSISRMDQSFVLLPKTRHHHQLGSPFPQTRAIRGIPYPSPPGSTANYHQLPSSSRVVAGVIGHEIHGVRPMEESFIVLPSAVASIYGPHDSIIMNAKHTSAASFSSHVKVLEKCVEIASQQTEVEHSLCLRCTKSLSEEIDKEVEEAKEAIKNFQLCIDRLQKQNDQALSDEDFSQEKLKVEEEERQLEAQIREVMELQGDYEAQLLELESESKSVEVLEERFWHDYNDFQLQVSRQQEERDATFAKTEVASSQLDMLKRGNVLNEAFCIWHDGEFGTINNFRLGRLPSVPVEWDEINAAWGQACLLLHTMAEYCHLNFTYRILPLGSYPRMGDTKTTYELFGPVNLFWSSRYDKAMTFFLACLKEFEEFAYAKDREANVSRGNCFKLPYR